ncbi:MAG TPA: hypothetical protein VG738_21945 [Chitinophagaceae bacterium]|nr:hypothetical protein [Chitinophagaceae bacterium]
MKKAAVILLGCLYMLSVCGISVNRFYCCGNLQSSSITATAFAGHNKKDDGCCRHTQTVFKVSDSHETLSLHGANLTHFTALYTAYINHNESFTKRLLASTDNTINGPPIRPEPVPLNIRFCIYRI